MDRIPDLPDWTTGMERSSLGESLYKVGYTFIRLDMV